MSVAAAKTEHLFTYKHLVDLVVGRNNKKRRVSNSVICVCSCVHVCVYIYEYMYLCVYVYIYMFDTCVSVYHKKEGKKGRVKCEV